MVNAYVTWVKEMEDLGLRIMSHLALKIVVEKQLVEDALNIRQKKAHAPGRAPRRPPSIHAPFYSSLKRGCIICGHLHKWYCIACGNQWMCRDACYYAHHKALNQQR